MTPQNGGSPPLSSIAAPFTPKSKASNAISLLPSTLSPCNSDNDLVARTKKIVNINSQKLESARTLAAIHAAANDDTAAVRLSVEMEGVHVDAFARQADGALRTPLMAAATTGAALAMTYLLANGADPTVASPTDGATALHCAAAGGSPGSSGVIAMLLAAGADRGAVDHLGRRAADVLPPPKQQQAQQKLQQQIANATFGTSPPPPLLLDDYDKKVGQASQAQNAANGTTAAANTTSSLSSTQQQQQQQQRILENVADDPSLANPLQRLNRLGTAWLGAVVELDGVLLSNKEADQRTAWLMAAEELGKTPPLKFQLDRAVNARNDVAVSEIFHWAREPSAVRRMSEVKENIFRNLQADKVDVLQPGMVEFLNTLHEADAPVCVASTRPRADVQSALAAAGVEHLSEHLVAAEDFYDRLDLYNYASTLIERPPVRCVVFGTSNAHIEGAHDAGMKCVVVPGPCQPTYELGSADLVLRDVSRLSFVNLKNLFANEQGVEPQTQLEEDESVDAISF